MNSPFAVDVARRIIARPEVINVPDDIHRVIAIYKIIFSRVPKPHETQMAFKFLGDETYASQTQTFALHQSSPVDMDGETIVVPSIAKA